MTRLPPKHQHFQHYQTEYYRLIWQFQNVQKVYLWIFNETSGVKDILNALQ